MSDLQILTGLSISISGYSQLRCGLSVYHWQVLVYLTWFCSLTHLSCLTFLRNYLYDHPGERCWRLIGMGLLVAMLIIALLPTGNYNFRTDPADYAICSFQHIKPTGPVPDSNGLEYSSMIISVLLLALEFISRVFRLHRTLSIGVATRVRRQLSKVIRRRLRAFYQRCRGPPDPSRHHATTLRVLILYRPLLALFLAIRVISDLWSSMLLEVWFLTKLSYDLVHAVQIG